MTEVQLVNFDQFDKDTIDKIKDVSLPLIDKFSRMFGENNIEEFKLFVKPIREKQKQVLYEVVGTLETTKGFFRTEENGWKILDAVEKIVEELERMITEKKDRLESKKKCHRVEKCRRS
jgi:ribosome-associated translation inhibitor RaiA